VLIELRGDFMKTNYLQKGLAIMAVAGLVTAASSAVAQSTTTTTTTQPATAAPVVQSAPPLAYGVSQILQLAQAKVSDDTIVAYVKNSGNSYGLDANQIIYLRQQGVSDPVITAMLTQPRPAVAPEVATTSAANSASTVPMPTTPAPAVDAGSTATVAPNVTYVQTVPSDYYASPYYYSPYYYGYGWYPGVVSIGWGGWYGGGWRGGGGWHGGGGFHGGGGGGGFHGGGGGGGHR
jgi:hypothetical protein